MEICWNDLHSAIESRIAELSSFQLFPKIHKYVDPHMNA